MISGVSACGREHKLDVRPSPLAPASSCEGGRGAREVPGRGMPGLALRPRRLPDGGPARPAAAERGQQRTVGCPPNLRREGVPLPQNIFCFWKKHVLSQSRRRGFSKMTSRGQSPPPPTTPAPPGVARLGEGVRKWRATHPLWSEGGGEGLGAQISDRGRGAARPGWAGERLAGSRFPRSRRAPHSVGLQVSTQFCQRPEPSWPQLSSRRHWRFGERRRVAGGGKKGGASPGPALPAGSAPPPTPQPWAGPPTRRAPRRPALQPLGARSARSRDSRRPGTEKPFLKKPMLVNFPVLNPEGCFVN